MFQLSKQKPSVWQMIVSVLAAMFGVQSSQARERDFQHGNPWLFIIIGLLAVILFVLLLLGLVYIIISVVK